MDSVARHLRGAARSQELLTADRVGGLFRVTQFAVARRTPEFSVRAALGANESTLLAQVLWGVGPQVSIAITLGRVPIDPMAALRHEQTSLHAKI